MIASQHTYAAEFVDWLAVQTDAVTPLMTIIQRPMQLSALTLTLKSDYALIISTN